MICDFKILFEEALIPSWIFDSNTLQFLEVNKAACKRYGYTREEFLSMTILDIRTTQSKIALKKYLKLDKKERDNIAIYWEHVSKTGSTFYVQTNNKEIELNGQAVTIAQALDVNDKVLSTLEKKELNNLVNKQQEELDIILSSVNEVIWAVRAYSRELFYVNDACFHVFGHTPAAMIADKGLFLNSIHPDDSTRFHNSVQEAINKGQSSCTFRIFHKNGSMKILKGNAVFRKGYNGEYDVLSGITTDITNQVRTEEMLREKIESEALAKEQLTIEENNLKALINNTPDLIWSINREKRIITANEPFKKAMKEAYGVVLTEGHDMMDIDVTTHIYKQWEGYYLKAFAGERFTIIDEQNVQGNKTYLKISFNPIFNEKNEVIGVSCFANDVTAQRTRLIRMQLQNERLKEIAWLHSHKVRGPVASMLGLAQLFNKENPEDPINNDVIAGIETALFELDNVIHEIDSKTLMDEVSF